MSSLFFFLNFILYNFFRAFTFWYEKYGVTNDDYMNLFYKYEEIQLEYEKLKFNF